MPVAFVLHAHLPWLRGHGAYPVGEEWLFQAWSESYLPLVEVLERLAETGARDVLTLGITPVLAEQLEDPYLLTEFHGWLGRRLVDLEYTVSRYGAPDRGRMAEVWRGHWRRQTALLAAVEGRFLATGLLAPFRDLARAGVIELLGGPATHPHLGLADDEGMVRGQMRSGLAVAQARLGQRPRGVWTPECAYRPAGTVADPTRPPAGADRDGTPALHRTDHQLPGLEALWAEAGVDHLVLDGPTLAQAVGAGERDWAATGGEAEAPGGPLDVLDAPVWVGDADLAAFGRNLAVSYAVWSPRGGYPADGAYRDFHRTDLEGGFKSWRVTAVGRPDKEPYDEDAAQERAVAHAEDFVGLLRRHLDPRPDGALVVAAYDAELFGHWWHEGPRWLEAVLRRLCEEAGASSRLAPTTLAAALERRPPARRLRLPESSWGAGKGHGAWVAESTRELWVQLRAAEDRFRRLPATHPHRAAAWRQLTLAQASDWPFMVVADQAARYARERMRGHLTAVHALCDGTGPAALAARDEPEPPSPSP